MAIRITRINPRTKQVERPWRNRDDVFVLGDPAHGAQKHHDKFAVKVKTIEEVAAYIGRGFSVRMTDGESPPSLISPDSLTVEQVDDSGSTPLWAETAPKPPFTKDEMMAELKRVMLVQANQIAHAGRPSFALAFMGFETVNGIYPYCEDDPRQVDLDRFAATGYLDQAYDYAFQVGQYWGFGDAEAQNVNEFISGANPQASSGDRSPLADPEGLCRRAADTAFGRWKLAKEIDLTVRELALLGHMKEAAVRNSLSKERIAIENGEITHEVGLVWLQQRRDFIPTRTEEGHKARWAAYSRGMLTHGDFQKTFAEIMKGFPMTAAELASKASVQSDFVDALVLGRPIPDLAALQRVGAALELDEPHFVGAAVEASLRNAES
jgi:hypothetical protein